MTSREVLDTDTLSAIVKPIRPARLQREVAGRNAFWTTAANMAEIRHGLQRDPGSGRLFAEYQLRVFPLLTVLPFDDACAELYGRVRADLERTGEPLGTIDLFVAAVCLCHDAVLVTGNVRHFERIPGLRVENWLADE
jgi:tRNA(fMet)-specific endonuclease VapC